MKIFIIFLLFSCVINAQIKEEIRLLQDEQNYYFVKPHEVVKMGEFKVYSLFNEIEAIYKGNITSNKHIKVGHIYVLRYADRPEIVYLMDTYTGNKVTLVKVDTELILYKLN